jgi:hypothetical protein
VESLCRGRGTGSLEDAFVETVGSVNDGR